MDRMTRREFMAAAAGAALLHGGGVGYPREAFGAETEAGAQVRLRRNVYCLGNSSPQIVAYRNAIAVMKARPATNGTSWIAQANIHGAASAPSGMIANACQHNVQFFLSWHRMYLHYFERIVRAASGDPNFALPYWGYAPGSTATRVLPSMFRTPAAASNVLYTPQRSATINGGAPLTASAVDPGVALLKLTFNTFTNSVSGTPHGVVHGGVGGLMNAFATAGQDPIFWLHHANIDRLWHLWLQSGGGRANPTTGTWLNTPFQFYDETGATVSLTGAQIVNTATQLSYQYASPSCLVNVSDAVLDWRSLSRIPRPDPRALEVAERIRRRPPLSDPPPPFAPQESVRLASAPAQVRIPVNAEARRLLDRFDTGEQGGSDVTLEMENIQMEQPAQVYYEVYLNLPAGVTPDYTGPHYLGNLDFFGPSPQEPHGSMPLNRSLSLLPAYIHLRAAGRWRAEELAVTFVPRGYTEGEVPARLLGNRGQAVIGRMSLRIQ